MSGSGEKSVPSFQTLRKQAHCSVGNGLGSIHLGFNLIPSTEEMIIKCCLLNSPFLTLVIYYLVLKLWARKKSKK